MTRVNRTLVIQGGYDRCGGCGARVSRWPFDHDRRVFACPHCGSERPNP